MIGDFIAYLKSHVGKAIYVWGGQGQTRITEAWIRKRENFNENNIKRVMALWNKLQAAGVVPIAAFDCSGLVMFYLQNLKGIYETDLSAAGLYRECHIIARNELREGDLLFRHNGNKIYHVGIYVNEGRVIECKGRDDGVVERDIDASGRGYWNRYGRLPALQLSEERCGDGMSDGSDDKDSVCRRQTVPYHAVCVGGSVNLRVGAGVEHKILAVAHKGDKLLALADDGGWCAVSAYLNGQFLHGFISEKYVARVDL